MLSVEVLDRSCIFDDAFMTAVFDHDPENAATLLRAVLDKPDLKLQFVETEYPVENPNGHSVRFDFRSDDTEQKLYAVEIQRVYTHLETGETKPRFSKEDLRCRASHDLYALGSLSLKANEPYGKQREHFVIYILDEDFFGKGSAVYPASLQFDLEEHRDLGPVGRGHVFFVNGAKRDENTMLGRLMIDFAATQSKDMHEGSFKETVRYLKETPEGRQKMISDVSLIMADQRKEAVNEAESRIVNHMFDRGRTEEEIADEIGLSVARVRELRQQTFVGMPAMN